MHDALVIGAGHNGLACAIHLAAKGWKVAVLEKAPVAGGAVKSAELTLPGFTHDLYAMNLSLFAGSPFFATYKDRLAAHGFALAPASDCFASAFPDGTWLGVSNDLETNLARIAALSQVDADAWRALSNDFPGDAPHIFGLLGSPMPSRQMAGVAWKAWRQKGTPWLLDTARLLAASPRDFLDRTFTHPKVKAMLATWGLHLDFPPDASGGALFPYLEAMAQQAFGMVVGKGGAATMISAMTGLLKELGGEIHTDAEVVAIETANGKASAVRLADGRRFEAGKAIVANAHPQLVFGKLLEERARPEAYTKKLARFRPGPGTMMVHLALDGLPDWAAGEALKRFAYVHLAPDLATMAATYAQAMEGLLPAEPVLVVGQPSVVDPSRAPAGKHVLWVQVRVLPAEIAGDAAGTITARDWESAKGAYAERVLDVVERYAPGLRGKILGRAVHSPADLERDDPNLIGGDSLAGSHHLDQNFLFRPVPGWSRYATPVKGLHICGASTWPGAGTGAGSGFMLGKMLAGA
ncbi:phytoene desaturase family protein [Salinarimonas ramus]|uniref:Pyridine nucleotide-disulfide oxidoreductase domain-containing protein 2 n=1 Tax=Salinarimonas ramus TaxID=690164 RepID=A0A917QKW6_9HYPH|nr:NAD(P)/FAD-dependent oxidoreductase [Salinarimonas ramus]GGK55513.1 dehydrogenase [Salinarimonas ramus]